MIADADVFADYLVVVVQSSAFDFDTEVIASSTTSTGNEAVSVSFPPDGNYLVEVAEPLALVDSGDRDADLAINTQLILDAIAAAIRRHPDQWLWLHDRWKMKQAGAADAPATEAVQ